MFSCLFANKSAMTIHPNVVCHERFQYGSVDLHYLVDLAFSGMYFPAELVQTLCCFHGNVPYAYKYNTIFLHRPSSPPSRPRLTVKLFSSSKRHRRSSVDSDLGESAVSVFSKFDFTLN